MTGFFLTCILINLGFEAGGGATFEKGLGKDLEDFSPAFSYGAELGVRDVLPGIGFDLGFRRFGVEKTVEEDTSSKLQRWEGYFFDGSAVFESWPFLEGPVGIKLRPGGFYSPWRMLEDGEIIAISPEDTTGDTLYMDERDWGVLFGGSIMYRPIPFLILEAGVNHRQIFSLDINKYGDEDTDERFLEVYIAVRARF